jgi:hypothetical protein
VQDCDLLGGFYGDGDQGAIGAEELVDLLGHEVRILKGVNCSVIVYSHDG